MPNSSFFLLGPRGVGKTTLITSSNWADKNITLLDQAVYQSYLAYPNKLYEELSTLPNGSKVFIDEIQKIPSLLNEIHRLIEDKKIKFALSGSSARKLKQAGTNLLGGRALQKFLFPLTPQEMGSEFDINEVLKFGSLPLIINSENPKETLESYVNLYLKEEIQAEAQLRNLGGFSRFLSIASLMHGQKMNLSNIAREAEVSRQTVQGFFSVLEDTLLIHSLSGYQAKIAVREKLKPKIYFVDSGIVRACRKNLGEITPDEKGHLLEGFIFNLLLTQKNYFNEIDDLFYWSPADAKLTEVDFLVVKNNELIAIEVKTTTQIRNEDLKGLKAINDLKNIKRKIVVYLGKEKRLTSEKIEILPINHFLEEVKKRNL